MVKAVSASLRLYMIISISLMKIMTDCRVCIHDLWLTRAQVQMFLVSGHLNSSISFTCVLLFPSYTIFEFWYFLSFSNK